MTKNSNQDINIKGKKYNHIGILKKMALLNADILILILFDVKKFI